MRSRCGSYDTADLLWAWLEEGEAGLQSTARAYGLQEQPAPKTTLEAKRDRAEQKSRELVGVALAPSTRSVPLLIPESYRLRIEQPVDLEDSSAPLKVEIGPFDLAAKKPEERPLTDMSRLLARVLSDLRDKVTGKSVDVRRLVRQIAALRPVARIPRRARVRRRGAAWVLLDASESLIPIWTHQNQLARSIAREIEAELDAACFDSEADRQDIENASIFKATGRHVLLIGELGSSRTEASRWRRTIDCLGRHASSVSVITPTRLHPGGLAGRVRGSFCWDPQAVASPDDEEEASELLFQLCCFSWRVEPGLLRDLRILVPGATLKTELEVWRRLPRRFGIGIPSFEVADMARQELIQRIQQEHPSGSLLKVLRDALEIVSRWHRPLSKEVWAEEVLRAADVAARLGGVRLVSSEDVTTARRFLGEVCRRVRSAGNRWSNLDRWMRIWAGDAPDSLINENSDLGSTIRRAAQIAFQQVPEAPIPEHLDPPDSDQPLELEKAISWQIFQVSTGLLVRRASREGVASPPTEGGASPLLELLSLNGEATFHLGRDKNPNLELVDGLEIELPPLGLKGRRRIITDVEEHLLSVEQRPEEAEEVGRDGFGLYVDFRAWGVSFRMRWIPPGWFRMGSPVGEAGRLDNSESLHEVVLTEGLWLCETACTQALWTAAMGENPSQFQSPDRPIESVSFDDVSTFLERLSAEIGGVPFRLPTEAEWERACRAGTHSATYVGDLEILGANNAPLLDEIAWYGGNCGVDFELESGIDSSDWPKKQFDHSRAGTHPVKKKAPNALGLYDMLGNVDEWCADWWADDLGSKRLTDPKGPSEGSYRVVRGGSWYDDARFVRAAFRSRSDPGSRFGFLGFRFARGLRAVKASQPGVSEARDRSRRGTRRGGRDRSERGGRP